MTDPIERHDPPGASQDILMRELLSSLLTALTLPKDVVDEALAATEPPVLASQPALGKATIKFTTQADEPHYPITLEATSAATGMFLVEGLNNTGKTTSLVSASIGLGVDWEDPDFQAFLQGEERYVETGKRFQREMEEGVRDVRLHIEIERNDIVIEITRGTATVAVDGVVETYPISEEGWRPFRQSLRDRIQAEFIPQKRDYLRQVYREVAEEVIHRLNAIESQLLRARGRPTLRTDARTLRTLEDEVEKRRDELQRLQVDFDETNDRLSLLSRVAEAEADDPDALASARQWACLQHLIDRLTGEAYSLQADEAAFTQNEQEYLRRQQLLTIAEPAVERLRHAVREARPRINSQTLRERVVEAESYATIGDWVRFQQSEYAPPGVYTRLSSILKNEPAGTPTFPLHDTEVFEREARTLGELADLVGEYRTWTIDFTQLLAEPLNQFMKEVADCGEIWDEDLENLRDRLRADASDVDITRQQLQGRQNSLEQDRHALAEMFGMPPQSSDEELTESARQKANGLERLLPQWQSDGVAIEDLLREAAIDPVAFWNRGGAQTEMQELEPVRDEQAGKVGEARDNVQRAEGERTKLKNELERSEGYQYARANDIVSYALSPISTFLRASFAEQVAQAVDLEQYYQPDMLDNVDIYTPLQEGMRKLVRDRCGSYYSQSGGQWARFPICDVDFATEAISVQGTDEPVRVMEQLGTGIRAAMTVRSLASRTRVPELLTVLLVDEWGDVEQHTLAQLVYDDIAELPSPVVALFTLPGSCKRAELRDAKQDGSPT